MQLTLKVDHEDPDSHIDVTNLKVECATEQALEEHVKNSGAKKLRLEFRQNCKRIFAEDGIKFFFKSYQLNML